MKNLAGSAGRHGFKGLVSTLALVCSLVTMAASAARAQSTVALSGNHPAAVPSGWAPAAEAKPLALTAVVALRNTGELAQLIHDLQDRHASRYHQWMTTDQFVSRFGPTPEQMSAVTNWLRSQGFEVTSSDRRMRRVNFTATVGSASQAFGISFVGDGTSYANTADPQLPSSIAPLVQAILGLSRMSASAGSEGRSALGPHKSDAGPAGYIADAIVSGQGPNFAPADLYKFYDETPVLEAGNQGTVAPDCIALTEDGDVSDKALTDFVTQFNLPPVKMKKILVNGGNPGMPSDNEPALDVEWAHAVAPATPIYFYLADPSKASTPYLDTITRAVDDNVCGTISSSFEDLCPDQATLSTYESVLQQAVVQGQTVFHSSGDYGSNWICGNVIPIPPIYDQSSCDKVPKTATGSQPSVDEEAASPNLTSVGGTQFTPVYDSAGNDMSVMTDDLEVTWNGGENKPNNCPAKDASGGGKSQIYTKPDWQTGFNVPNDGARDVPDVAMGANGNAPGFFAYSLQQGQDEVQLVTTGGTSIATPMWAGVSRLIANAQGVARLGNVNPRLYELGNLQSPSSGLHDIVAGNNDDSGIPGFNAGPGYDQVTGWGSPDIALLVAAFPGASLAGNTTSVSLAAGESAEAGSFSITNTTADPLQLTAISIRVTSSGLLSQLQADASAGGSSQQASVNPSGNTTLSFPTPLVIPASQSAQVVLTVRAAGSAAPAGTIFDPRGEGEGGMGAAAPIGILAVLAVMAAMLRRKRLAYAAAALAVWTLFATAASSCGGSGGSASSGGTATLTLEQGSVQVDDGQGGVTVVGGLPLTVSIVKVK